MIAEIGGVEFHLFRQYHCRKCEKKNGESNCGNGIAEIGGDLGLPK